MLGYLMELREAQAAVVEVPVTRDELHKLVWDVANTLCPIDMVPMMAERDRELIERVKKGLAQFKALSAVGNVEPPEAVPEASGETQPAPETTDPKWGWVVIQEYDRTLSGEIDKAYKSIIWTDDPFAALSYIEAGGSILVTTLDGGTAMIPRLRLVAFTEGQDVEGLVKLGAV